MLVQRGSRLASAGRPARWWASLSWQTAQVSAGAPRPYACRSGTPEYVGTAGALARNHGTNLTD